MFSPLADKKNLLSAGELVSFSVILSVGEAVGSDDDTVSIGAAVA